MHTKAATTPHLSVHKFRCFGGDLKCVCTGSDVSMLFCADGAPFLVVPFAPTCHKPETVFFCSSLLRVPKVLHSPSIILHVFYKVVSGYGGTSCKQSVIKYLFHSYLLYATASKICSPCNAYTLFANAYSSKSNTFCRSSAFHAGFPGIT